MRFVSPRANNSYLELIRRASLTAGRVDHKCLYHDISFEEEHTEASMLAVGNAFEGCASFYIGLK